MNWIVQENIPPPTAKIPSFSYPQQQYSEKKQLRTEISLTWDVAISEIGSRGFGALHILPFQMRPLSPVLLLLNEFSANQCSDVMGTLLGFTV